MNNVISKNATGILTKDLESFINQTGKYGCMLIVALVIVDRVYDLSVKAMDKGCTIDFTANRDGVEYHMGAQPSVT